MLYLTLFYTFFIIGAFGFGGGYAMLSLIQHEVVYNHHWVSSAEFTNIVAVSQMTPGPLGINCATYCGYSAVHLQTGSHLLGIAGAAISTTALVLPSLILMILISRLFLKYMNNGVVMDIFSGIRPAVVGMLAAATLLLCNEDNFSSFQTSPWHFSISVALFIAAFFGVKVIKVNPIRMIIYAAFAGLLLLY